MAGDDLDDDYAPDELVAVSEDEGPVELVPLDGEEDVFVTADDTTDRPNPVLPVSSDEAKKAKKRKRKAKDNERKAKKQRLALSDPSNPHDTTLTAVQSPDELAGFLSRGQDQVLKNLSAVELDDLRIPASCIVDTRDWKNDRTLETIADFIRHIQLPRH